MAAAPKPKEDWETILAAKVRRLLSEGKDRGKDSLRILVTGRTGAGKSALVNSIVGEYVAEEGYYQYGETTEVTKYEKKVGDIVVTIYDSPGLQDGIKDKHVEEEYLKDLERNCREVDLNLFCVRMNDMIRSNEIDAIKKLSNAFGRDKFWQNTLIVLTFANEVKPPKPRFSHDIVTPVTYFSQRLGQWKIDLQFTLTDMAGISKKVVENVPIVPAGYSDQPSLPAANCDYWLSNLWFQCLNRTKDIAKPILLNINWKRLRPGDHIKEEDIPKKKGYKQPIVTKHQTIESYLSEFSIRGE